MEMEIAEVIFGFPDVSRYVWYAVANRGSSRSLGGSGACTISWRWLVAVLWLPVLSRSSFRVGSLARFRVGPWLIITYNHVAGRDPKEFR